ncbi:50S ribosomal protein L10 [Candidatus Pacearchaeota archaeon]|nr:50S ribosomal protein L10 [Candidatus Pacearchaeota archaeon]MBI2056691.1 50S ribosomal protein L10 [Candidatus Pacearchaeota archaeon]
MKQKIETQEKKPKKISEVKLKAVKEFENLVKNKRTILVSSIKNIPASQVQEISKKLRGKAIVKVPKKNLIFMGLDFSKDKEIEKLKDNIKENFAILFSDLDSFELAGELIKNQSPAKAKTGQIADKDLEIPEGPTELIPGPAVSELSALGIKIQIEKGKITIKAPKIIVKKGEKISQGAAEILNKLDIKPFKVGFIPICSFDAKEKIFYSEIKIDKEGTIERLKTDYSKALSFAVEIGYSTKDTIKFLISRAGMHEKALEKLSPNTNTPEENKSEGEEK